MKTFARDPRRSTADQATSRTDRRSPARIEDAERQSSTAPSAPAVPDLAETVAIGGVTGASATGSAEATSTAKDAVERLPQDIAARFPDADLSGVRVHRDAQQAAATGAAAFTQGNDIFVAPGQLTPEVLAHEAAHVVQQRLGRSAPTGQDGKAREREAEGAEKKNRVPSSTLGAATPGTRQNKEKAPDGTEVEKKGPRLNITLPGLNGTSAFAIEGVEGSRAFKAGAWWPGPSSEKQKPLFEKDFGWRIPGFPVAEIVLKAKGGVKAGLETTGTLKYKYKAADQSFAISGEGKLALFGEVSADVLGGLALDAVFVEGGVGVFCKPKAKVEASTNVTLEGLLRARPNDTQPYGELNFLSSLTLGGTLKGELGLRAWLDGWFIDEQKEWTFAQFPIAWFDGFRLDAGAQLLPSVKGLGGKPSAGKVGLGSPPNIR